jgi:hypothetical protein
VRRGILERLLWVGAAAGVGLAGISWRRGIEPMIRETPFVVRAAPDFAIPSGDSIYEAAAAITELQLFGSPVSETMMATAPALPRPPKPALVLRGVLGGPPWTAVVEGIPGQSGTTVVRPGDVLSGLTIRSVQRAVVVVRGMDTTWTLTLTR